MVCVGVGIVHKSTPTGVPAWVRVRARVAVWEAVWVAVPVAITGSVKGGSSSLLSFDPIPNRRREPVWVAVQVVSRGVLVAF